jgi:hypothetical protein
MERLLYLSLPSTGPRQKWNLQDGRTTAVRVKFGLGVFALSFERGRRPFKFRNGDPMSWNFNGF